SARAVLANARIVRFRTADADAVQLELPRARQPAGIRVRARAPGRDSDLNRLGRFPDPLHHAVPAVARGSAADPWRVEPALRPRAGAGGELHFEAPGREPAVRR